MSKIMWFLWDENMYTEKMLDKFALSITQWDLEKYFFLKPWPIIPCKFSVSKKATVLQGQRVAWDLKNDTMLKDN